MRTKLMLLGLMFLPSVGCTNMNNTEQGAVTGGLLGGLAGLVLGGRHPAAAALVGTGVGAVAGGALGASQDNRANQQAAQVNAIRADQARRQMSLNEIVQMTQQNVNEQIIINQINTSGSVFDLRADDIGYLKQQGVSDRVISEMQRASAPRTVIVQPGRYYYPPPPPPMYGGAVMVVR